MPAQCQPKPGPQLFVGLLSGTSADGIDAVVEEVAGSGLQLRARVLSHTHQPFPSLWRQHILRVCFHGTVAEICELNFAPGETHNFRAWVGYPPPKPSQAEP